MSLIELLILTPFMGICLILTIQSFKSIPYSNKKICLFFTFIETYLALFIWMSFDNYQEGYQLVSGYGIFTVGIDGISLCYVLLTTLLTPVCILASWDNISKDS